MEDHLYRAIYLSAVLYVQKAASGHAEDFPGRANNQLTAHDN